MNSEAIVGSLVEEVASGRIGPGAQLYVSVGGAVVADVAVGRDGLATPVATDSLFAIYCAAKPVFVVGLLALVADGELSLDDRIGDVLQGIVPPIADLRVIDLLDHTSGLHGLDAHLYLGASARLQALLVADARAPEGWRVGTDVGYCQVTPWELLGSVMAEVTGEPVHSFLNRRVVEPMGLEDGLFVGGMAGAVYERTRHRFAVNIYNDGPECYPILSERSRRYRCLPSPAFGNTATIGALGRFYDHLLGALRDESSVVPAELLTAAIGQRRSGYDVVMERLCDYGAGVMVNMSTHHFGSYCSTGSFGHSGYGGMTAAFADPEHDVVVAFHICGRVEPDLSVRTHRPAFVGHIYEQLGIVTETTV